MVWTDFLVDAGPIRTIYPVTPGLKNVRMHEVRLHQDGPMVSLRFDLDSYPDSPPRKWLDGEFNQVQLTLMLVEVTFVQIHGWGLDNIGNIDLLKTQESIRLRFAGETTEIDLLARFIRLEKISAYNNVK